MIACIGPDTALVLAVALAAVAGSEEVENVDTARDELFDPDPEAALELEFACALEVPPFDKLCC